VIKEDWTWKDVKEELRKRGAWWVESSEAEELALEILAEEGKLHVRALELTVEKKLSKKYKRPVSFLAGDIWGCEIYGIDGILTALEIEGLVKRHGFVCEITEKGKEKFFRISSF
jgi:hypothetical protein